MNYDPDQIRKLYTAVFADAVRTVANSKNHRAAYEAGEWLEAVGPALMVELEIPADERTVTAWTRRQVALRRTAQAITPSLNELLKQENKDHDETNL